MPSLVGGLGLDKFLSNKILFDMPNSGIDVPIVDLLLFASQV